MPLSISHIEYLKKGVGVSAGVAHGVAHVLQRERREVPRRILHEKEVSHEIARLQRATARAVTDIHNAILRCETQSLHRKDDVKAILDVQMRLLQGSRLLRTAECRIKDALLNAEYAIDDAAADLAASYAAIDDAYLSERATDMRAAAQRIRWHLHRDVTVPQLLPQTILVTNELMPADIMLLNVQHIAGIVTEVGGKQGHTAILARALRIPAVSQAENIARLIRTGQKIAVCGNTGEVYVDPPAGRLKKLAARDQSFRHRHRTPQEVAALPSHTADLVNVDITANIELPIEVQNARQSNAHGIGLMRSEFIYMGRDDLPSEEDLYLLFSNMAQTFQNYPVTVRLLDVGADKSPASLREFFDEETNPALGVRGVRLMLKFTQIIVPQLRAALRANALHGNIRVLIPMVTDTSEVAQIRTLLQQQQQELQHQNIAHLMPKVGIMIEVPATAVHAAAFAQNTDFFAIGSNDLLQYLLAVDRGHSELSSVYDCAHPALWQLLHYVMRSASRSKTPVSICGEVASDTLFTPLLLGIGLRSLSMPPYAMGGVKEKLSQLAIADCQQLARKVLRQNTAGDVRALCQQFADSAISL